MISDLEGISPLSGLRRTSTECHRRLDISFIRRRMFYFVTACPGDSFLLYSIQMQVFLRLTCVTMVVAATRMHRSLTNFVSGSTDVYDVLNFLTFSCSLQSILYSAQGDLVQNSSLRFNGPSGTLDQSR